MYVQDLYYCKIRCAHDNIEQLWGWRCKMSQLKRKLNISQSWLASLSSCESSILNNWEIHYFVDFSENLKKGGFAWLLHFFTVTWWHSVMVIGQHSELEEPVFELQCTQRTYFLVPCMSECDRYNTHLAFPLGLFASKAPFVFQNIRCAFTIDSFFLEASVLKWKPIPTSEWADQWVTFFFKERPLKASEVQKSNRVDNEWMMAFI